MAKPEALGPLPWENADLGSAPSEAQGSGEISSLAHLRKAGLKDLEGKLNMRSCTPYSLAPGLPSTFTSFSFNPLHVGRSHLSGTVINMQSAEAN